MRLVLMANNYAVYRMYVARNITRKFACFVGSRVDSKMARKVFYMCK